MTFYRLGTGDEENNFIANTGYKSGPSSSFRSLPDLAEKGIAYRMAEKIVNVLKSIKIDANQRE